MPDRPAAGGGKLGDRVRCVVVQQKVSMLSLNAHPQSAVTPARLRARRGFTLVEILTVVLILGIASAIIAPQIGSRGDLKVRAAARVLVSDLTDKTTASMQRW